MNGIASVWNIRASERAALAPMQVTLLEHGLDRKADADAELENLIATYGASEPFRIAEVYAYRGEIEEAFKWLQTTARLEPERRPPLARFSPFLKPLHTDARWDAWTASTQ